MNTPQGNLIFSRFGSAGKEFFFQIILTVGLFLSVSFVPLAGFFAGVLTPAPTVLAIVKWGLPSALIVPGCAGAVGSLALYLLDLSPSIPYLLALLGLGVLMGIGLRRQWPVEKVVLFPSLIVIGMGGLLLVFALIATKGELVRLVEQDLTGAITATLKQLGTASTETGEFEAKLLETVPLIVRTIPGILISCTLGIAWLNLLIARRYCRVSGFESCSREKLTLWKAPEFIVWFVIAGGLMLLLPFTGFKLPAINLLIVLGTIYFLQGLAVVAFYLERLRIPFFVKGFLFAVLFLQQFASLATAALGLFDVWFDFRKFINKPA